MKTRGPSGCNYQLSPASSETTCQKAGRLTCPVNNIRQAFVKMTMQKGQPQLRRTQEKIPLKETLLGQPSCAGSQSIQTPGGIFIPSHLNDHFSRSLLTESQQITGSPEENDYDELILKHRVEYIKKKAPTNWHTFKSGYIRPQSERLWVPNFNLQCRFNCFS